MYIIYYPTACVLTHLVSAEMIQTYSILHRVAAVCVEYLMKHVVEDRALVSAAAPSSMVNHWLNTVDRGMVCRAFESTFTDLQKL